MLHDFLEKDMIEQINILEEIRETSNVEVLPQLMEIYATKNIDQVVDETVYHALYDLLAGQVDHIKTGIEHTSRKLRIICVRRAKEDVDSKLLQALTQLLEESSDTELISEVLRALGGYNDPGISTVLIQYIDYDDASVAAWAMRSLVDLKTDDGQKALEELIVKKSQESNESGKCGVKAAQAITNITGYQNEQAADFLMSYVHHQTPGFRRVVINALAGMGEEVLPAIEKCFLSGDKDEKIMAANIVGWVGLKKGVDLVNAVFDREENLDTNFRFALYESLGRIPSIRSVISLTDALEEHDEMVLMAVVTGLNDLCSPEIVNTIDGFLGRGDAQSRKVSHAIISGHLEKIFVELYRIGEHTDFLIEAILALGNKETSQFYRGVLKAIGGVVAEKDMERLDQQPDAKQSTKILAADDSKAILAFYKAAAVDLGVELVTVPDGSDALDYLEKEQHIDLLITDMNMPNVDGVELTTLLRKKEQWKTLPILMVTTESEKSQSDQAIKAGVDHFLSKPFSKDVFVEKVKEILPG